MIVLVKSYPITDVIMCNGDNNLFWLGMQIVLSQVTDCVCMHVSMIEQYG